MITQIQTPNGRHYQTMLGVFPSVTTILKATESDKDSDRLRKWQHKMDRIHGTGSGETQAQAARDRGTAIHKIIAATLYDADIPEITTELVPYWKSVKPVVKAIKNPGYCEHPVYHGRLKYAGTFDLIADWQGLPTIIDWKTSHRTKRLAWLNDYTLQIAAYAKAYEWLYGTPIQQTLIVIITPERSQLFEFSLAEVDQHFKSWQQRLVQYYSLNLSPAPNDKAKEQ